MHIAIAFDRQIPAVRYGGSDRIVWWLGKELIRRGHQVVYVVPRGSVCDFAEVIPYDANHRPEQQLPEVDLVHDFGVLAGRVDIPLLFTLLETTARGNSSYLRISR